MSATEFIEQYTTKDQDDWLVQKKDIVAKFMEAYSERENNTLRNELNAIRGITLNTEKI